MQYKKTQQKGYAILFTVMVVSIILTLTIGLSNTAYKQILISSVARDSGLAFYQADTATECALYQDRVSGIFTPSIGTPVYCGVDGTGTNTSLSVALTVSGQQETYNLTPTGAWNTSLAPCFNIIFTKVNPIDPADPVVNTMQARGYNLCVKSSPRAVEREIQINY
jgi:hypothetical protein